MCFDSIDVSSLKMAIIPKHRSKLIVRYKIYIIVHLLVLIEFVNQFPMHGTNYMTVYCSSSTWQLHVLATDWRSSGCIYRKYKRKLSSLISLYTSDIQGVSGGIVNILGDGSMEYSE